MEKSIETKKIAELLFESLQVSKVNPRQYSPLTLAFIGDSVYDLIIRTKIVSKANAPVHKLHVLSSSYVKAASQAKMMKILEEHVTEEEFAVYKRGRNAKSGTVPKNANLMDYKNATGFEALLGYLYLKGDIERISALVNIGLVEYEKN